ncbi:MAG: recombination mediator RecR [Elusimicrobiota bacterium]
MGYPKKVQRLINALRKLPEIGPKMAERLANHIINSNGNEIKELTESILEAKTAIMLCKECFTPSEDDVCEICRDDSRDGALLCVVAGPAAINSLEKTRKYNGLYFIIDTVISPRNGRAPGKERIEKLLERTKGVKEIIIATDTDTEGEITANYIAEIIKSSRKSVNLKITRLGYGMPVGGSLEYADEITLTRSLEGRREI